MAKVSDLYGAGSTGRLLRPALDTPKVRRFLQHRHSRAMGGQIDEDGYYRYEDHEWKVPLGVRVALKSPLIHVQLVNKYPWAVTWVSPRPGHKRLKKYFMSLPHAMHFVATKAQYVDPHACILSRARAYDLPAPLRERAVKNGGHALPGRWKWCPRCMQPRKFYRVTSIRGELKTFHATRKEFDEKGRPVWKARELALLRCKYCNTTNRDPIMRRSNQLWEKRRFKKGVTRARRRRR